MTDAALAGSTSPGSIAALVLAAGGSRRLGEPKQLLRDHGGEPLIVRIVRQLHDAEFAPIVVVTGAHADRVAVALETHPVHVVHHAGWSAGMGSTIAHGIAWIATSVPTVHGVVITACDMPAVTATHLRTLRTMSAAADGTRPMRVASVYGANGALDAPRGIPAFFPREDWPALQALGGDMGARALLRQPDTLCAPLPGGTFDLDTPADVARWRAEGRYRNCG